MLCSQSAHLWATSDFVPRSEAPQTGHVAKPPICGPLLILSPALKCLHHIHFQRMRTLVRLLLCVLIGLNAVTGQTDAEDITDSFRGSFYSFFKKRHIAETYDNIIGTGSAYLSDLQDTAKAAATRAKDTLASDVVAGSLRQAKDQVDSAATATAAGMKRMQEKATAVAASAKDVMSDVDLSSVTGLVSQAKEQLDGAATATGASAKKMQATAGALLHQLVGQVGEMNRSGNYSAAGVAAPPLLSCPGQASA